MSGAKGLHMGGKRPSSPLRRCPESLRSWARAVAFLVIAGAFAPAFGQGSPTPTPQQLEMFRGMSPEQQRAVLEAANGNGSATRTDAPLVNPPTTVGIGLAGQQQLAPVDRGPPRISRQATVVLSVELDATSGPQAPAQEVARAILGDRRARVLAGNPYRLDSQGQIALPFLPPIALSGLTAQEAAGRLTADPRLDGLRFGVSLLPLDPVGVQALKPFGYDLFSQVPTTFAPATDVPVPSDYVVGPGDNIVVDLFGQRTQHYSLVVDRNGAITIPDFGPIQVVGLDFNAVRAEISQRVSTQMIGVQVGVTMGQLRSIRVFVLGDVVQPGSYTVSGLSTVTNALLTSGGISTVGSLRNIEIKRSGRTVGRLDLYDLLLSGDTSGDMRLEPGDVIFVPPVGLTASIAGEIRRPAIYEMKTGGTVSELLLLSGGLSPQADPRVAKLERIDTDRERTVLDLDVTAPPVRMQSLRAGDVLTIPRVLDQVARSVTLEGYVLRPGAFAWRAGMRLTDLLASLDALRVNADQRYVLIRREHLPDRRIEVLSADALRAFAARGSEADPLLESRDRVTVFSRQRDRGDELAKVLQELRLQVRDNQPQPVVSISGRVRAPGQYPLEQNMTVSDLLRAGGGLDDAAFTQKAELMRYEVVNGQSRQTEVIEFDLAAIMAGDIAVDRSLRPYDVLLIKETPDWREQQFVSLLGEVRFPGTYSIRKSETLSSVIQRAGGLTDVAFARGSVFTREEVKTQEAQQMEVLAGRLQADLSQLALASAQTATQNSNSDAAQSLAVGQSLLSQLRSSRATGRLVIDLERGIEGGRGNENDLELRNGDTLTVPRLKQFVTVIGEVQNAATHVWHRNADSKAYLDMSGGSTSRANKSGIYVVRANGSVVVGGGSKQLQPGDTIVVPLDTEPMRPLPLWTAVTTIIYNMAVSVAAIGSI
jgi:protein involved in polysaccharide export with SLBB domain